MCSSFEERKENTTSKGVFQCKIGGRKIWVLQKNKTLLYSHEMKLMKTKNVKQWFSRKVSVRKTTIGLTLRVNKSYMKIPYCYALCAGSSPELWINIILKVSSYD